MRPGLWGFAAGSLGLVVLYAGLQTGAASAAQAGSGVLVNGLRRLFSPDVAGVPQRKTSTTSTAKG